MILQSPDEIIAAADRHGLPLMDYRTTEEKAGLQPLDASRFSLSPWARWIAMDSNGKIYEYADIPRPSEGRWFTADECEQIGRIDDTTGIDWRQTLTPVNHAAPVDSRIALTVTTIAQLTLTECEELARQIAAAMGTERTLQLCAALDDAVVVRGGQAQPARDDDYAALTAAMQ